MSARWLPWVNLEIATVLSVAQAQRALRDQTSEESFRGGLKRGSSPGQSFRGVIREHDFRLVRGAAFRDPLVIKGTFRSVREQAIIDVRLRLPWFFYALFPLMALIWPLMVSAIVRGEYLNIQQILLALVSPLSILIVLTQFRSASASAQRMLRRTFDAELHDVASLRANHDS